jgi:ABC-type nitrate/sulfonate/bicarbonate transport system substrate-binding protein
VRLSPRKTTTGRDPAGEAVAGATGAWASENPAAAAATLATTAKGRYNIQSSRIP